MVYTVIRLRGIQNINPKTKHTLRDLRLNRVNHAVVLPESATTKGMLQVAKDYVTWGEVDAATLANVIKTRGRLVGDKPITDAYLAKATPYKSIDALAAAVAKGEFAYKDIPEIKPLFRLHPAHQGHEGIKRSVQAGGALGYRGADINELLGRMLGTAHEDAITAERAPANAAAATAAAAKSAKAASKKEAA